MTKHTFRLCLVMLLLSAGLPILGCDRSAEVDEEALTEGEPLAEADSDEGDFAVHQAGPAAWNCELYDQVKEEGTATHDAAMTAEAEAYVAESVRSSLADGGVAPPEDDVDYLNRVRGQLSIACGGDPTILLSEAASRIVASWEVEGLEN
ncbi:MAG TPA: hypothetical protein VMT85_24640 [Thermoanaerobaculia bacterium]|nr:hypothetical protein [Thermoanaerobaculia bacterium]